MRSVTYLRIFICSVLIVCLAVTESLFWVKADPLVWIGALTIVAEGLGFIGISVVEITLFLGKRKKKPVTFLIFS